MRKRRAVAFVPLLDEQTFRYNHRKDADGNKAENADRFKLALSQFVDKRLTYAE